MSSPGPTFGLHEGSLGLHPMTFLMEEKKCIKSHMMSMDNVGWDCRDFFSRTTLEDRLGGMFSGPWGITNDNLSKA